MPGNKKAQRTKGNVKPSSSSQAAQLLAASGQAVTGFVGFSTQPAFVPASEAFDDVEASIDDDFRLVLRKISKRDSVTKIKALQEFIALCNSKNEESIKAIVPFWPRVYNKIAIDVDHKVRELSHKTLAALANRAGKALAPHLKSIMGLWMVSMCDTYPTVASAANVAFTSTFSPAKQTEAIRFCKAEITECLVNHILHQTPQSLSDPTTSPEDIESKYERVVSASLQAFSKMLHRLPVESLDESLLTQLAKFLESSAFWKHAKSSVPQIKCGILNLLSTTCQLCPTVSSKTLNKVSPYIFSCLDATDPSVISITWEAVLSLISSHQECWQHVNWQKAVWPKIKQILEQGCFGQASVVCPCLLPLLSKIPKLNLAHFFEAFRLGLSQDSVQCSQHDLSIMVRSFLECVQFSIKQRAETDNEASSETRSLILDQVLPVVQASLTDSKPGLSKTDLYARLCPVLSSMSKTIYSIEEEFWAQLSSFLRNQLLAEFSSAQDQVSEGEVTRERVLFQRVKLLYVGLVYQTASSVNKTDRVKFATEEVRSPQSRTHIAKDKLNMTNAAEEFIGDIFMTVFKLASVKGQTIPLFFSLFRGLAVIHISCRTVERLNTENDSVAEFVVKKLGDCSFVDFSSGHEKVVNSYEHFLQNQLAPILAESRAEKLGIGSLTGQFTGDVILAVLAFVSYIPPSDGASILSEILNNIKAPETICQFIEHILSQAKYLPACKLLVTGRDVSAKIDQLTKSVIGAAGANQTGLEHEVGSSAMWKMLTSVVTFLDDGDVSDHLVSSTYVDAILSSCLTTLHELKCGASNETPEVLSCVVDLVLALLDKQQIALNPQLGELTVSLLPWLLKSLSCEGEIASKTRSAWLAGLRVILQKKAHTEIEQFLVQFSNIIKEFVKTEVSTCEGLQLVQGIVKTSLGVVASPTTDVNDPEEADEKTELGQVKDIQEAEVDVEALSSTVDMLLIPVTCQIDYLAEVSEYLYLTGRLDGLPSISQSDSSTQSQPLSLASLFVQTCYNMEVLLLAADFYRQSKDGHRAAYWSKPQLLVVADLCYSLCVLESARTIRPLPLKDFPETLLLEIKAKLAHFINGFEPNQMSQIVTDVTGRTDRVLSHAAKSMFVSALTLCSPGEVPTSLSSALLSLRIHFLNRCLSSKSLALEVSDLLAKPLVSGHDFYEAFTFACTLILSSEDFDVGKLADCVSGFMHLAKDYQVLTSEVKLSIFDQVTDLAKQLKDRNVPLLSGSDTSVATAERTHLNVTLAQALKLVLLPSSEQYWDFTLCSVVEWLQYLSAVKVSQSSDAATKALLSSVCELTFLAAHTLSKALPVQQQQQPQDVPESSFSVVTNKSKTEWNEFFSEGIYSQLLPLFVSLASILEEPIWSAILLPVAAAASLCPSQLIINHQLPAQLTITDTSSAPDSLKTLFNHLGPLLVSTQRCLEVAAYKLLSRAIEEIPKYESMPEEEGKQEEEVRSPPEALIQQMESASHFLDCLKVVQLEDHVQFDRGTPAHAQAMGYLLTWQLLLQLFKCSPNQLRAKYAQFFKSSDYVSHLLDSLFRLMPRNPSQSILESPMEIQVLDEASETELSILALHVYRQCLEILPALVRTWWVNQDRKSSNFVDRFTTQYLSNHLIWHQITSAQNISNNIEGITIRARPAAREVSATYEMAEVTVNMSIVLPENYPLGKLEVACDKRVGVSQAQWDRWLLQLNIFLQHQNGSIVEGLRLWKGNIDKKFEGVEECMICFSVIHGTTFQLPRLTCKTCRKKYHSSCLYKWFNTSQKSSCPLCRNLF